MIHYQTAPLGDEEITKESFLREKIEALLGPSQAVRSTSVHKSAGAANAALAKQ
jgi:hypothetical protein